MRGPRTRGDAVMRRPTHAPRRWSRVRAFSSRPFVPASSCRQAERHLAPVTLQGGKGRASLRSELLAEAVDGCAEARGRVNGAASGGVVER